MIEEPGAGIPHAGICAGGGRVTDRPYGDGDSETVASDSNRGLDKEWGALHEENQEWWANI